VLFKTVVTATPEDLAWSYHVKLAHRCRENMREHGGLEHWKPTS
jgi:hypothetical protein